MSCNCQRKRRPFIQNICNCAGYGFAANNCDPACPPVEQTPIQPRGFYPCDQTVPPCPPPMPPMPVYQPDNTAAQDDNQVVPPMPPFPPFPPVPPCPPCPPYPWQNELMVDYSWGRCYEAAAPCPPQPPYPPMPPFPPYPCGCN